MVELFFNRLRRFGCRRHRERGTGFVPWRTKRSWTGRQTNKQVREDKECERLGEGASPELAVISGRVHRVIRVNENSRRTSVSLSGRKESNQYRDNDHVPLRTCTDYPLLSISLQGFECSTGIHHFVENVWNLGLPKFPFSVYRSTSNTDLARMADFLGRKPNEEIPFFASG